MTRVPGAKEKSDGTANYAALADTVDGPLSTLSGGVDAHRVPEAVCVSEGAGAGVRAGR